MEHKDALSVEEAATSYEVRERRARKMTAYVVAAGAAAIVAVVALGLAGVEPIQ
ncbi:hypothetical protein [Mumia sp. Pv 4-285]|uniref:hypothetical protein n=1 Tax=Mumia qirimensis TaxID=3234852 RepID=UPI00351D4981